MSQKTTKPSAPAADTNPTHETRAERRARRAREVADLDPRLAATLTRLLDSLPADQHEGVSAAVGAFCAWVETKGTDFSGYDDAFAAYEADVDGTAAAATLPYVQLLLVALDEGGHAGDGRGIHAA